MQHAQHRASVQEACSSSPNPRVLHTEQMRANARRPPTRHRAPYRPLHNTLSPQERIIDITLLAPTWVQAYEKGYSPAPHHAPSPAPPARGEPAVHYTAAAAVCCSCCRRRHCCCCCPPLRQPLFCRRAVCCRGELSAGSREQSAAADARMLDMLQRRWRSRQRLPPTSCWSTSPEGGSGPARAKFDGTGKRM